MSTAILFFVFDQILSTKLGECGRMWTWSLIGDLWSNQAVHVPQSDLIYIQLHSNINITKYKKS